MEGINPFIQENNNINNNIQEEPQVQQVPVTMPENYPYLPQRVKDKSVLEFQLTSQEKLFNLRKALIGGYYVKNKKDEKGNPLFIKTGLAMMTEEMAESTINLVVESVSGKEIYLSYMTENNLLNVSKDIASDIIEELWSRDFRKLGKINKMFVNRILHAIENCVQFLIMRSLNGATADSTNNNVNVSENRNTGSVPQGRGSRFGLNFFGGNRE